MSAALPQNAATVLVARDSDQGPEVYMVRRHGGNKFMANAHVFVGGKLDAADSDPLLLARVRGRDSKAARDILGEDLGADALGLYVAAFRETFEEAGLLLAVDDEGREPRGNAQLARDRDSLNADSLSFLQLLTSHKLWLPADRLRYLSRWITPEIEPRRFDARFFVCRAPRGQEAANDPKETSAGGWFTIAELLRQNRDAALTLAPPTLCTLEDLAHAASVDEILALAPDRPVEPIRPRILTSGVTQLTIVLPGDHRHLDAESKSGPVHAVVLEHGSWRRTRN